MASFRNGPYNVDPNLFTYAGPGPTGAPIVEPPYSGEPLYRSGEGRSFIDYGQRYAAWDRAQRGGEDIYGSSYEGDDPIVGVDEYADFGSGAGDPDLDSDMDMGGGGDTDADAPAPDGPGSQSRATQMMGAKDLLSVLTLLRQLRDESTTAARPGMNSYMDPYAASMPPPAYIERGNTTFGGIPYARNKYAVALSGMGSMLNNLAEMKRMRDDRMKQQARQERLDAVIDKALTALNTQFGNDTPQPYAPPSQVLEEE